jgi:hypothetical protein
MFGDERRKWGEAGEDCIMRNFTTFMLLHQIILGPLIQED